MNNKGFGLILGGLVVVALVVAGIKFMPKSDQDIGAERSQAPEETTQQSTTANTEAIDDFVYEDDVVLITADIASAYGIDRQTSFTLNHIGDVTAEEVAQTLVIDPEVPFKVTSLGERQFRITPLQSLPEARTMKLRYKYEDQLYGYAFNTYEPFKVKNEYPKDGSEWVDISTGMELEFNRPIDGSITDFITLVPKTDVTYRAEDNRVTIIPSGDLVEGTDYTICIASGYQLGDESLEAFDYTFRTGSNWNKSFYFPEKKILAVDTAGPQIMPLYGREEMDGNVYDLRAYRIEGDVNAYLDQTGHKRILLALGHGRLPEATVLTKATYRFESWQRQYLILKDVLPKGVYYIAVGTGDEETGTFIQVTDKSAFILLDEDELVFWAVEKGLGPLTGGLYDGEVKIADTDSDGFLRKNYTPNEGSMALFSFDAGDEILYLPTPVGYADDYIGYDYYSYLYTDRSLYKHTDTINVSGYIRNRYGDRIDEVRVDLTYNNKSFDSITLPVSEIGSYSGSFDLEDYNASYLTVQVYVKDEMVDNLWLSVFDFEKPTYQISGGFDKDFIPQGGSVNYQGSISYFDGTPLDKAKMAIDYDTYSADFYGYNQVLTSGDVVLEDGVFYQPMELYAKSTSWYPQSVSITARPKDIQSFYSNAYSSIYVFPKDRMVELDREALEDGSLQVAIDTHMIDLSKIKDTIFDPDIYRGEPVEGQALQVTVTESYQEKVFIEQRYDAIIKETYDVYDYVYRENVVYRTSLVSDLEGKASFNFDGVIDGRYYTIDVTTNDGMDSLIEVSTAYGSQIDTYFNEGQPAYSLELTSDGPYGSSSIGGSVVGQVMLNKEPVQEGKTLFLEIRDGIRQWYLRDNNEVALIFDESRSPGTQLRAVYFNGSSMVSQGLSRWMTLDISTRGLKTSVTYDKEAYKPGDEVAYELQVVDVEGNPVKADVNISVVDEAFIAVSEDYRDPESYLLYPDYITNTLGEYTLTSDMKTEAMAEGGEGGDEGYRSEFEDTAWFTNVTTGDDGIAIGAFVLPDNITSWRMTMTSFTKDTKTGKDTSTIQAGLPFFADTMVEDSYLAGDDIYIKVRSAGESGYAKNGAGLTVSLDGGNGKEVLMKGTTTFGKEEFIKLGALEEGSYKLYVDLSGDEVTDRSMYSFKVLPSRAIYKIETVTPLTTDLSLTHNDAFVEVSIYNKEAYDHFRQLDSLTYGSYNKNFLRKITAIEAEGYSAELYGSEDLSYSYGWQFMGDNGLIKPLENAKGDIISTTRTLAIGYGDHIEDYERDRLMETIDSYLSEGGRTSEAYIGGLWVETLLEGPDLMALNEVAAEYAGITTDLGQLMTIRALSDAGAITKASLLLENFMSERNIVIDGTQESISSTREDYEVYSAMRLGIMTGLESWDEGALLEGMIRSEKNPRSYFVAEPELLLYLMRAPKPVLESKLTVAVDGLEEAVTVDYLNHYNKVLTPEEAESFEVMGFDGNLILVSDYYGKAEDLVTIDSMPVKRSYRDMNGGVLEVGDMVEVSLTFDRPFGQSYFHLQDSLPAGLTFFKTGDQEDNLYLWGNAEGVLTDLHGYVGYYDGNGSKTVTFKYEAMASAPGVYRGEPTIVESWSDSNWVGDEQIVEISQ